MEGLTVRQVRFVNAIAENEAISATKAAILAGYSETTAAKIGSENLQKDNIIKAIADRREQLAAAAGITPALILREWLAIATANPAELVSVLKFCCPECWEMDEAQLPPNDTCKACRGAGVGLVNVADTRTLTGSARRLYAGAKQTKDGIEIKMRDQDGALAKLADYLGMLNKSKGELSGPGGGPIPIAAAVVRAEDLTDDQLAAYLGVAAGVSEPALPASVTIDGTCETLGLPE